MEITKTILQSDNPHIFLIDNHSELERIQMVMNLVLQILATINCRMLICTSGDTDLDKLLIKLANLKKFSKWKEMKMIRFSIEGDAVLEELKMFTLDDFVKHQITRQITSVVENIDQSNSKQIERKNLISKFNDLQRSHDVENRSQILDVKSQILALERQMYELKCPLGDPSISECNLKKTYVDNAEIVGCTLENCHLLERVCEEPFNICIVDNATNIPEMQCLSVIRFDVRNLILCGDETTQSQEEALYSRVNGSFKNQTRKKSKENENSIEMPT